MAGELGIKTVLSCTSLSKIWEPAGDDTRGEPDNWRIGDEGCTKTECSPVWTRVGDVVALEGAVDVLEACEVTGGVAFASEAEVSELSPFFFPKPNRDRFLALASFWLSMLRSESGSSTARGVESSKLLSSATSLPLGNRSPLFKVGDSARLMVMDNKTRNKRRKRGFLNMALLLFL